MHRRLGVIVVAATLLGCGPKKAPDAPDGPSLPILPAPEATRYAVGPSAPRDGRVAALVDEAMLPWDEALSGAAGAIALDTGRGVDLSWARWAARRAGYPHPVVAVVEGIEPVDAVPSSLGDALRGRIAMGEHVGVARARVLGGDRWVALIGRPGVVVEPFDRVVEVGAEIPIETDRPATGRLLSPAGVETVVDLPGAVTLDAPGEWWLGVIDPRDDAAVWISVPLYAGVRPPPGSPVELPGVAASGPSDAEADALAALAAVRDHFDRPPLRVEPTLSTLGAHPLQQVLAGAWDRAAGEARLAGAGFVGGPVAQVWCRAATAPACIDDLLTRPDARGAILDARLRVVGVAAQVDTAGVTMVVDLASE